MRYLVDPITRDLKKKMVFLGGPRQCGKTTLAKSILASSKGRYLNWDSDEGRASILSKRWDQGDHLLVMDELHKYPRWKNWIKGVYDTQKQDHQILVTGSARLDVYKRGGDSLLGRYHYWRLHPFTLSELPKGISSQEGFSRLMKVGGFPEPFLDNDERESRRWRRERFDRILRDDIRDLEPIRDLQTLSLFVEQLRTRVGGPVVLSSIANELQVSPKTVKHWLEVLEKMYLVFVVRPLTKDIPRAILKPPKVYFFDNADVMGDEGAVFENLVATHLLKRIQYREDHDGYRYELRYLRDKEGREVDFAILRDGKLEELIEVKYGDPEISRSLSYYSERLKPGHATQIVAKLKSPYSKGALRVQGPIEALSGL
jgi:predicted AAA+ superfamily ATPase